MSILAPATDAVCLRIESHLRTLRLPGMLARYRGLAEDLEMPEGAYDWLEESLAAETASRDERRLARNLKAAHFPMIKELVSFDFAAQPSVPKARMQALATGQFIAAHEVVILVGGPGTGKSHLLLSLSLEAVRAGYRVRFVTAAALVNELLMARRELRVPKVLKQYAAFDLVAVDELGYVPFSHDGAQLLFQFFADRYERRATAITTHLPFTQWPQVFGDETMTVALLDRLTHRCHVLNFNGESYRMRESRQRAGLNVPNIEGDQR